MFADENGEALQEKDIKRLSRESEGLTLFISTLNFDYIERITGENRVTTPTTTESTLPWKRGEDDREGTEAVQQTEFPAWAKNKEYLAYNSPSATFLGKII